MATYVNDLRLKEIATGDEAGTWGTSTNTNLELIGEALGFGTQDCFSSDANATTTVADGSTDPTLYGFTLDGKFVASRNLLRVRLRVTFALCKSIKGVVLLTRKMIVVIVPSKFENIKVGLGNKPFPEYLKPSALHGILAYVLDCQTISPLSFILLPA